MQSETRGFTLIELMIVVAVVAILASVAYPSYQDHIRKARRVDAQTALLELTHFMERYYTTHGTYLGAVLPFNTAPRGAATPFYNLTFSAGPTATAYTLQATRVNAMADDPCGNLRMSSTGARTTELAALDGARCWHR